jgi:chromosomal replication initiation ATPase DnaA
MPSQIPLPLENTPLLTRENFIVCEANRDALSFIDSWPAWAVSVAVLYGPGSSGKSHLAEIWAARSGAQRVAAAALSGSAFVLLDRHYPVIVEDIDSSLPNPARDAAIFDLVEAATPAVPVLLTGRAEPSAWQTVLPDLASRFSAAVSFSLWAADENLLRRLAQKLFEDRQLTVPDFTIEQILRTVERTPAAIRAFVTQADAKALAEGRPINSALVRELLVMTQSPGSSNFGNEIGRNSSDDQHRQP